ncbi:hypothetical protein LV716_17775 [Flagellimonas sp. HMM57]|uniref:hypothetical protein n=1 Tax=unclassified Flagellimonas TaxID=2644544 RepID=UPI0013D74413|nr:MULTISPECIES: hypothetical protein [unclassified Flagellimonas]MBS9462171.1 hypothetical protein [Flagellimonas sp. 389]UII76092.1 hypothetical protein LV716_17775 [Flagellimonas sp. HMM57]
MKKRHQQKLVVLAVLLFFLWNVPFVTIFDGDAQLFGFPIFYVFIFLSWFVAIIVSFLILKKYYE